mgnify:CR=1 FL=1
MAQYISKSALVVEIEKMQDTYISKLESRGMKHEDAVIASVSYVNGIKDIINTLEVKEVDLEKEYKDFVEEDPVYNKLVNGIVGKAIAKHFFELGLKVAQKGEEI